jgi:acetyl-CoA C-acetyltransferase
MKHDQTPVVIGVGQLTQREVEPVESRGPVEMMAETARRAAVDTGAGPGVLAAVDSVAVINVLTWYYGNAPRLLAEQIGAHPAEELYTTIGGNMPQWVVNETAAKIAAGRVRLALLAGAEALHALGRAQRSRTRLPWVTGGQGSPVIVGDARPDASEHEIAHGFQSPVRIYPLFENALRARSGRSVAAHRDCLGDCCSRLSAVAADNPYAWFRQARTAAEITTPTPHNRMICFPYTKFMNAIMNVDQAAAVLMTSVAGARALGVPEDRWVYLWASADSTERWFVSDRLNYYSAPALRVAGERALTAAGLDIGDLQHFDLYSCFPSSLQLGCEMLGIKPDDPRALTVTGGLSYAGGPGSNYTMHAIATMVAKLRAGPGTVGLITGLGWYFSRHAIGIYSGAPPIRPWRRAEAYDGAIDGTGAPPPLAVESRGPAVIETYTVMHDHDGMPIRGLVIGRQEDGRRFLANTPDDRGVLEGLMAAEGVGRRGRAAVRDGINRFDPD